jgi:hypothetical protein
MENLNVDDLEPLDEDQDCVIEPASLELALEFTKRYTKLLLDRKMVANDVKALRKEFNEQGLPTNIVVKAFAEIRKEKKEAYKDEIHAFKSYISKNAELMRMIQELESSES